MKRMRRQTTNREKILTKDTADKGLVQNLKSLNTQQ